MKGLKTWDWEVGTWVRKVSKVLYPFLTFLFFLPLRSCSSCEWSHDGVNIVQNQSPGKRRAVFLSPVVGFLGSWVLGIGSFFVLLFHDPNLSLLFPSGSTVPPGLFIDFFIFFSLSFLSDVPSQLMGVQTKVHVP